MTLPNFIKESLRPIVPEASLMMVTYNRLELTKETLASLLETTQTPFELILVDNGSSDGTPEYLDQFCQQYVNTKQFVSFKIIKNEKNLGIAIARNQCLQAATTNWLATVDNDVILPYNWLAECIELLTNQPKYAAIGVNFEKSIFLVSQDPVSKKSFQHKPVGNLGTACMVFHRKLHKLLGFFNTEYGIYGEEDADFGARIRVLKLHLGYLLENGKHLGEGENDQGEYREFKTKSHADNLAKFNHNCRLYHNGLKPLYIPFKM